MLWRHEPTASVFTAFSKFFQTSTRVSFNSIETKRTYFPGSFRKCRHERKNSSIKLKILFTRALNTPTSRASSVFLRVNKHNSKPISNRTGIQENYVSQINYLPQSWASGNILLCSPLTNHDILLNLVQ